MVKTGQEEEEENKEDLIRVRKKGMTEGGEVNVVGEELMKGKSEDGTGKGRIKEEERRIGDSRAGERGEEG